MYYIILLIIAVNLIHLSIQLSTTTWRMIDIPPPPPLVGSNKCTWGPSYWCFSEENAKECNFDYNECLKYK
jgi:Saposin A-type domain